MTWRLFLKWFAPVILLTGCFPISESYFQLVRPDAKFYGTSCGGGLGPPSVAYFPHGEIWLSVMIVKYRKAVLIGVHIPAGQTAQVLDRKLKVVYEASTGKIIEYPALAPGRVREGNPEPRTFRSFPDPYGTDDFFGLLVGDTKTVKHFGGTDETAYKVYRFQADFDLNRAIKGSVMLPTIRINGRDIAGPTLNFERSSHFELATINC